MCEIGQAPQQPKILINPQQKEIIMFKLNDVVRVKYGTHKGKTFQVVGFAHKDSLGKLITCRLYRSQYRFNFMPWQIEVHPFFA